MVSGGWIIGRVACLAGWLVVAAVDAELVAIDVQDFVAPGSDHRGFVVTVVPAR